MCPFQFLTQKEEISFTLTDFFTVIEATQGAVIIVVLADMVAKSCLFTHPADTEQHIHLLEVVFLAT